MRRHLTLAATLMLCTAPYAIAAEPDTAPMNSTVLHQAPLPPKLELTAAQRDQIRQAVAAEQTEMGSLKEKFEPQIGAKVPSDLQAHPLPKPLVEQIPQLERYTYAKFKGHLLLINPMQHQVAEVIAPPFTTGTAPSQPPAAPPQQSAAPAPQQSAAPEPDHNRQAQDAQNTPSGQAGKQEPKPTTPTQASDAVLVDGKLNVAGAPTDSQTVPAKFSKRKDELDKLPTMAFRLSLNDEQKRTLRDGVRAAGQPVADIKPQITEELPNSVATYDLPEAVTAAAPSLRGLKYIPLKDKILLIDPPNRIVVGEIGT